MTTFLLQMFVGWVVFLVAILKHQVPIHQFFLKLIILAIVVGVCDLMVSMIEVNDHTPGETVLYFLIGMVSAMLVLMVFRNGVFTSGNMGNGREVFDDGRND